MINKPRGATLLEAVIALTIFSLVTGLGTVGLVQATRYQQRLLDSQTLEAETRDLMTKLTNMLWETSIRYITADQDTLIFPSPRDTSGALQTDPVSGAPLWPKLVCIQFRKGEDRLVQLEEVQGALTQPNEHWSLSPARNRAYFQSSSSISRVLSQRVKDFEVRLAKPDTSAGPRAWQDTGRDDATVLHLELELSSISQGRDIGIRFSSLVVPRNT